MDNILLKSKIKEIVKNSRITQMDYPMNKKIKLIVDCTITQHVYILEELSKIKQYLDSRVSKEILNLDLNTYEQEIKATTSSVILCDTKTLKIILSTLILSYHIRRFTIIFNMDKFLRNLDDAFDIYKKNSKSKIKFKRIKNLFDTKMPQIYRFFYEREVNVVKDLDIIFVSIFDKIFENNWTILQKNTKYKFTKEMLHHHRKDFLLLELDISQISVLSTLGYADSIIQFYLGIFEEMCSITPINDIAESFWNEVTVDSKIAKLLDELDNVIQASQHDVKKVKVR